MELSTIGLLLLCMVIALGFEFVNGFHDTANAVATVIYTRSLKPWVAVLWSGLCNFLGAASVLSLGAAVAFKIVNLLPTDLLATVSGPAGIWMILSVLIAAVSWNVFTWYFAIPCSSSHTLIGSILGVGLMAGYLQGKGMNGLNIDKTLETLQWLFLSPLIGFGFAGLLHILAKWLIKNPQLFQSPAQSLMAKDATGAVEASNKEGKENQESGTPPWPIRMLLIGTCTGVSYVHGSNDGQKGIGLVMLILIALLPSQFTVSPNFNATKIASTTAIIQEVEPIVAGVHPADTKLAEKAEKATKQLAEIEKLMQGQTNLQTLPLADQQKLRGDILKVNSTLKKLEKDSSLTKDQQKSLKDARESLSGIVEYVAWWVILLVALALGVGTTIGWKRVVVTVGEKIGKTHMTYAQGACAELAAMCMIAYATSSGMPVSTTHVVSSGVAGTMAANKSGLQAKTLRNILMAWVLTLPVTILLSSILFYLTAGRFFK
jgi:inorganic phosphate transporter, PiT family